jgi:MoxR-like ATPase
MFHIIIDYPSYDDEKQIVKQTSIRNNAKLSPIINKEKIIAIQNAINDIPVNDHVIDFAVKLVRATRPNEPDAFSFVKDKINWGAGPRASQYLVIAAKTRAILNGRLTPAVEDVIAVSDIVLRHRVLVSYSAESDGLKSTDVVRELIQRIVN